MATTADAEAALAALLWSAMTPLASVVKVIRGWPSPSALNDEIKAGHIVVSVFRPDISRNTSRYLGEQSTTTIPAPTLVASMAGTSATFSGTADLGQIAGVIAKGIAYPVRTVANDTPAAVVARIAEQMSGPVTVSGATITAGGLSDARTAADATSMAEVGRQENTLQADLWCPTPALRDQAESLVVPAVAGATFLAMPDGSAARTRLGAVFANDQTSPLTIYRLMLRVTAEVKLTLNEAAAICLWPGITLGNQAVAVSSTTSASSGTMTVDAPSNGTNAVTFTQTTPAGIWTITHNLNRYPNVVVIDTAGDLIEPGIDYPSLNVVRLTFSLPTAGTAYLS